MFGFDEIHVGFRFELALPLPEGATINWYSKTHNSAEPFPLFITASAFAPPRFLSADEQKIFHRALRRSVRVIAKANRDR